MITHLVMSLCVWVCGILSGTFCPSCCHINLNGYMFMLCALCSPPCFYRFKLYIMPRCQGSLPLQRGEIKTTPSGYFSAEIMQPSSSENTVSFKENTLPISPYISLSSCPTSSSLSAISFSSPPPFTHSSWLNHPLPLCSSPVPLPVPESLLATLLQFDALWLLHH